MFLNVFPEDKIQKHSSTVW